MNYYKCNKCGDVCFIKTNIKEKIKFNSCDSDFVEIEKKYFIKKALNNGLLYKADHPPFSTEHANKKKIKKRALKKLIKKNNKYGLSELHQAIHLFSYLNLKPIINNNNDCRLLFLRNIT